MKLAEILDIEQDKERLDEISMRKAAAIGAFAVGAMLGHNIDSNRDSDKHEPPRIEQPAGKSSAEAEIDELASTILKKYKVSPELATKVATLAKKYEKESFPRAKDILAIAGIESSFRPHAVSQLKNDPAVGLMQVRPGVWGLDRAKLEGSVEKQIKAGAEILHKYYKLLGDEASAVHAYNVGIGNFRRGKHNIKYVNKYQAEVKRYKS